ncbi:hypothetical protein [Brevibacterium oceani]|uniref:hypothetical protein n=1 Tax=Brevibacterium oceani TaxID=358099 RepID=UPI0015E7B175|nr:hypothetical protein [Brevibacterium oceani]
MPDRLRLYTNQSLFGIILYGVGFERPESPDVSELALDLWLENPVRVGGDFSFCSSYGDAKSTGGDEALESSQSKELGAVEDGQAVRVNVDVWILGPGPPQLESCLMTWNSASVGGAVGTRSADSRMSPLAARCAL